jgi:plastocyanin
MPSSRATERRPRFRRSVLLVVAVAFVAAGLALAGFALAGTTVVTFTSTGPQPSAATVNWGDTVQFTNADTTPYTLALADDTGTETQTLPAGGSYAKVFDGAAGAHHYTISGTKKFSGNVGVSLTGAVSLTATTSSVLYGSDTTLSGNTTYTTAPVTIQQAELAQSASWSDVSTVTPAADGSFSLTIQPSVGMRYRAITAAQQLSSNIVRLAVEPRITAQVRPRTVTVSKKLVARATISPATAATSAYLTQHTTGGRWKVVAQAKLDQGIAKLRWAPEHGGKYKLRVEVQGASLGSGFAASASNATRITAKWRSKLALRATAATHGHTSGFQFAPRFLRAHAGRVTLVLKNLDSHPHNIALKGRGVTLRGRVVNKGGVSRVAATLKPGTYTFYSSLGADSARGTLRVVR